jgi:hypothetical protein
MIASFQSRDQEKRAAQHATPAHTPPMSVCDFSAHWKLLQDKALEVMLEGGSEKEVQKLLDSLTQLLFGLDEYLKQKATNALDLIIQLVNSTTASQPIILSALKAIQSCVTRNAVGRQQCRAAGVFEFLSTTLDEYAQQVVVVEEAMTTLAAMSMCNDLNAKQVCVRFYDVCVLT